MISPQGKMTSQKIMSKVTGAPVTPKKSFLLSVIPQLWLEPRTVWVVQWLLRLLLHILLGGIKSTEAHIALYNVKYVPTLRLLLMNFLHLSLINPERISVKALSLSAFTGSWCRNLVSLTLTSRRVW